MLAIGAGAGGVSSGFSEPERARGAGAGAAGESEADLDAEGAEEGGWLFGISGMARDEGLGGSFLASSPPTPARLACCTFSEKQSKNCNCMQTHIQTLLESSHDVEFLLFRGPFLGSRLCARIGVSSLSFASSHLTRGSERWLCGDLDQREELPKIYIKSHKM